MTIEDQVAKLLREAMAATGADKGPLSDQEQVDLLMRLAKAPKAGRQKVIDDLSARILVDDYRMVGPTLLIYLHNAVTGNLLMQAQAIVTTVVETLDDSASESSREAKAVKKAFRAASRDADGLSISGCMGGVAEVFGGMIDGLPKDRSRVAVALALSKIMIVIAKSMDDANGYK